MKRKLLYALLLIEAALCVFLFALRAARPGFLPVLFAFPFEQIGLLLRSLSLSGRAGNAAAVILYAAICLFPMIALLRRVVKRRAKAEDGLLALLCAMLFACVYLLINPGILTARFGDLAGLPIAKALLGGMLYSVIAGYLCLRVVRSFFISDGGRLQKYAGVMIVIISAGLVFMAFGACFGEMLASMRALSSGNTGTETSLAASRVFLVLKYVADALPYIMDLWVALTALTLLSQADVRSPSAQTVAAAEKLSRRCTEAIAVTVLSGIAFTLLQLLCIKSILTVSVGVRIPLVSMAFLLTTCLLSRIIRENKRLKDDNDRFI